MLLNNIDNNGSRVYSPCHNGTNMTLLFIVPLHHTKACRLLRTQQELCVIQLPRGTLKSSAREVGKTKILRISNTGSKKLGFCRVEKRVDGGYPFILIRPQL